MSIQILKGDLLKSGETLICHQTNCLGVMGGGIALQIKKVYPEVYENYRRYCLDNNPINILGTAYIIRANDGRFIANVFGQNGIGAGKMTQEDKLESGLLYVRNFAEIHRINQIGINYMIGCGLAGGDWKEVKRIIERVFENSIINVNIYDIN